MVGCLRGVSLCFPLLASVFLFAPAILSRLLHVELAQSGVQAQQGLFDPLSLSGGYESYFVRVNAPRHGPGNSVVDHRALWVRYTRFMPAVGAGFANRRRPLCEVWAVASGVSGGDTVRAIKKEFPLKECTFADDGQLIETPAGSFDLRSGRFTGDLNPHDPGKTRITWDLNLSIPAVDPRREPPNPDTSPLLLLPALFYTLPFPPAKALVIHPRAEFHGRVYVDEGLRHEEVAAVFDWELLGGWRGSVNHNWGTRHTHAYAWGQVAGTFDNHPGTFLELATAQPRAGAPFLTLAVLRHMNREYRFNDLGLSLAVNFGNYTFEKGRGEFMWRFEAGVMRIHGATIRGTIRASRGRFAGLTYYNPPGGDKHCLNSKTASAEVIVTFQDGTNAFLRTESGAAFEIFTEPGGDHGVEILI